MESDRDAALVRYYSAVAHGHEPRRRIIEARGEEADAAFAWAERLARGKRVLEIACGTGLWTRHLASSASQVLATDLLPDAIAAARRTVVAANVRFEVADAYDLRDGLGVFDLGFAAFFVSHVPKRRLTAFFDAARRRLAPGGRIAVIDNTAAHAEDMPITSSDDEGNTYQRRALADGSTVDVLKNFPARDELLACIGPAREIEFEEGRYFWRLGFAAR